MRKRSSHVKCHYSNISRRNNNNNNKCSFKKNSLYELSLSLVLLLWCLVFLFYSDLGLGLGNAGNSSTDNKSDSRPRLSTSQLGNYTDPFALNTSHKHANGKLRFKCSEFHQNHSNSTHSIPITNGLELVWNVLGYSALVCESQLRQTKQNDTKKDIASNTRSAYLNLDEFRDITRQEKRPETPAKLAGIIHQLESDGSEYNYASASKGAKVVAHNKEAKGPSNILEKDHDKYLRNPCSVSEKFVVIELAEQTLVDVVRIANFEHYSSNFKEFELSGSLSYPADTWLPLGRFTASNIRHVQTFKLSEPRWVRFVKLNLTSHHGSEFYCTLSVFEVFGVDAMERMLEDLVAEPNSTALPSSEPSELRSVASMEAEKKIGQVSESSIAATEKARDPVMEVRKQANGRVSGETILKILMQKVRSSEVNLSVLESYIKEMNRRQRDVLPAMDAELARVSSLLEKSRREIGDLLAWKEIVGRRNADLELWKTVVSTQLELLVKENSLLRLEMKKILDVQANQETKEMAVLAISLFLICFAILKIVLVQF